MNAKFSRWILTATVGAMVLAAAPAFSQDAAQGGYKIGVVNRAQVFAEYKRKQEVDEKLQAKQQAYDQELDGMLQKLSDDAKAKGELRSKGQMTSEQITAWEKEFKEREIAIKSKGESYQAELNRDADASVREIADAIHAEVDSIAQAGGYHLILEADRNPTANSPVVFFQPTLDITTQVITNLNTKYKGSASASDPAKPAEKAKG